MEYFLPIKNKNIDRKREFF